MRRRKMNFVNELEKFKNKFDREIQTTVAQKGARTIPLNNPLIQNELSKLGRNACDLFLSLDMGGECAITIDDDAYTRIIIGNRNIVSNKKVYSSDDLSIYESVVAACCLLLDSIDSNNIDKFLA